MASIELQALASRLGRPVQSMEALDKLSSHCLEQLLEALDQADQQQHQALQSAYGSAMPKLLWRLITLGLKRDDQ